MSKQVGGGVTERVAANGSLLNVNARHFCDSCYESGHLLIGELGLQGNAVESACLCGGTFEAANLGRFKLDDLTNFFKGSI